MTYRVKKWYLQESNQGHKDFQSFALPTELRYPAFKQAQIYAPFMFLQNHLS